MSGSGLIKRQLLGDGCEKFANVFGSLCRCFKEEQVGLLGVRFGISNRDRSFVGLFGDEIELVASKGNDDVFVGLALEFFNPSLSLIQRSL